MPEMDGWEVCKALRQKSTVPILMLTALGDEVDRILGLELGADDYLTKPFSTRELIARLRALLRRVELDQQQVQTSDHLSSGDIRIELNTRRAFKGNDELQLRHKEFEMLVLLLNRPGEVITRAEFFDKVWGTDWRGDTAHACSRHGAHALAARKNRSRSQPTTPPANRTRRRLSLQRRSPHLMTNQTIPTRGGKDNRERPYPGKANKLYLPIVSPFLQWKRARQRGAYAVCFE